MMTIVIHDPTELYNCFVVDSLEELTDLLKYINPNTDKITINAKKLLSPYF